MSDLTLLSPDDPRWRTFAVEYGTSPLQRPAWLDTLTGAYRLEARVMALTDPQGLILAAMPMIRSKLLWRRRWTALPFTDTLEPVSVDIARRDELLRDVADGADAEPVVIRAHADLPGWFSRQVGTVQVLDLSNGAEGALRGARRKTRQNVGFARKAGLTARPITSRREFLGAALAVFARTRQRLGAPTQPRRYWTRVWALHERGEALTIGAYLRDELVATATFIIDSNHAVFKYSASDTATRNLRSNYLAFATALEHIAERGMRSLDFGITDLSNASLRNYKVHWGGEEQPAYFSATDASMLPETLEPGPLLTKAIQRTPAFVGRAVGSVAYPFAA